MWFPSSTWGFPGETPETNLNGAVSCLTRVLLERRESCIIVKILPPRQDRRDRAPTRGRFHDERPTKAGRVNRLGLAAVGAAGRCDTGRVIEFRQRRRRGTPRGRRGRFWCGGRLEWFFVREGRPWDKHEPGDRVGARISDETAAGSSNYPSPCGGDVMWWWRRPHVCARPSRHWRSTVKASPTRDSRKPSSVTAVAQTVNLPLERMPGGAATDNSIDRGEQRVRRRSPPPGAPALSARPNRSR
jgi:hypothetical protein